MSHFRDRLRFVAIFGLTCASIALHSADHPVDEAVAIPVPVLAERIGTAFGAIQFFDLDEADKVNDLIRTSGYEARGLLAVPNREAADPQLGSLKNGDYLGIDSTPGAKTLTLRRARKEQFFRYYCAKKNTKAPFKLLRDETVTVPLTVDCFRIETLIRDKVTLAFDRETGQPTGEAQHFRDFTYKLSYLDRDGKPVTKEYKSMGKAEASVRPLDPVEQLQLFSDVLDQQTAKNAAFTVKMKTFFDKDETAGVFKDLEPETVDSMREALTYYNSPEEQKKYKFGGMKSRKANSQLQRLEEAELKKILPMIFRIYGRAAKS